VNSLTEVTIFAEDFNLDILRGELEEIGRETESEVDVRSINNFLSNSGEDLLLSSSESLVVVRLLVA